MVSTEGNCLMDSLLNDVDVCDMKEYDANDESKSSGDSGVDHTFELIHIYDLPSTDKWAYHSLRNVSLIGKEQFWQVGFDPSTSSLLMWSGYIGGIITPKPRVVIPKSNKTMQQQALQEAHQRYKLMIRKGYSLPGSPIPPMFKIMRSEDYNKGKKINFPASAEPKLDGIRIYLTIEHGFVAGKSRGNIYWTTMTHILEEAYKLLEYLPPGSAIDAEMWNIQLGIQMLTSITRTVNTVHPLLAMLELHIFDVYLNGNPPYEERRIILEKAIYTYRMNEFDYINPVVGGRYSEIGDNRTESDILSLNLHTKDEYMKNARPEGKTKIFLTSRFLVNEHEDIVRAHEYYISNGYEGTMVKRHANGCPPGSNNYKMSQYLFGKGARTLKYKDWIDDEGICVGVTASSGTEAGCALLILEKEGKRFTVRMKGGFERRREWFINQDSILGKPVTYKYYGLTNEGYPRHPTGIEVRDYEPGFVMES
jgi:ATP-dependent DNA ligase